MSLNLAERFLFEQSLHHPWIFSKIIRPRLYERNNNDPEQVHESVLDLASESPQVELLKKNSRLFQPPENLQVSINGRRIVPFGTAAGMDKNGDALLPFSYVFGFQELGTVVVNPRSGNNRPRVAADDESEEMWNAQGFPSKGLQHVLDNVGHFREAMGYGPVIYASVCGLPISEDNAVDVSMGEMTTLLNVLKDYVDGFVWNVFSPNTAALTLLRKPEIFRQTSQLMEELAPDHLRLYKAGPYEDDPGQRRQALALLDAFLEGGGHGVVAVNTKMFPKDQIPVSNWGYQSGGRSGRFLKPYRTRAIRDAREAFPSIIIFATGGISGGDDAYETFEAGANAIEGFTPYTFHGLGLLRRQQTGISQRLWKDGYENLEELQSEARKGAKILV